jgi:hypothetical protein
MRLARLDIERQEASAAGREQFELVHDNHRETGRRPRSTGPFSLSSHDSPELQIQRLGLDTPLLSPPKAQPRSAATPAAQALDETKRPPTSPAFAVTRSRPDGIDVNER